MVSCDTGVFPCHRLPLRSTKACAFLRSQRLRGELLSHCDSATRSSGVDNVFCDRLSRCIWRNMVGKHFYKKVVNGYLVLVYIICYYSDIHVVEVIAKYYIVTVK